MNISKEMRLHQWAQDMAEQQASGLTQKQWCKMKGMKDLNQSENRGERMPVKKI